MSGKMPIVYGAFMLTGVNLLLRFVSTSFQVYLSATIGPAGVGLLQLVLSVSGLAMTAGIAGIRTTTMYLTAEELGKGRPGNVRWVLSGCFLYCILTSAAISLGLSWFAPTIAQHWIGDMHALPAIRTFAAFLPINCLCGVMTGYFTAANRIGTLAAVEVAEQFLAMGVTFLFLLTMPTDDTAGACRAVVLGSCCGYGLTLSALMTLHLKNPPPKSPRIPVRARITGTAIPLALADDLKAGISSLENLMVPKRLALYPRIGNPLAAFGIVTGMVFPVIMFPAAILFSLAELLLPEFARCAAVKSKTRIRYLIHRNLRVTLIYGLICGGGIFLLSDVLCQWLYPGVNAAGYMRWFSALVPMLYCDLMVDCMTKGLGQQTYCVKYNIISNSLDVALLFVLLPRYGIVGYYASFLVTHLLNFILSVRRLQIVGNVTFEWAFPCFAGASALLSVFCASRFTGVLRQIPAFLGLFFCLCYYFGILQPADLQWLKNLLTPTKGNRRIQKSNTQIRRGDHRSPAGGQ